MRTVGSRAFDFSEVRQSLTGTGGRPRPHRTAGAQLFSTRIISRFALSAGGDARDPSDRVLSFLHSKIQLNNQSEFS